MGSLASNIVVELIQQASYPQEGKETVGKPLGQTLKKKKIDS